MKQKKTSILLLITLLFVWGFTHSQQDENDFSERAKINLRAVGNQLLLSQEDSLSLVLPITKIDDFKYKISFEKRISFEPSVLVNIVKNVFNTTMISKNYRVEVIDVSSKEVGYSYEISTKKEKTLIPCAGRDLPEKNYSIELKFLDQNKSKPNYNFLFYILIVLFLVVIYKKYFSVKQTTKQTTESEKIVSENAITLGSFQFYPDQNKLIKKAIEIPLSKKECELLEIFVANPNQIIKREALTKRVWEDNGVFVSRSLDTYISKLRKKLKEDKSIQLVNIHGVGYKLEIK